jgi:hypothetical protein
MRSGLSLRFFTRVSQSILALAVPLTLVACGGEIASEPAPSGAPTGTPTSAPTSAPKPSPGPGPTAPTPSLVPSFGPEPTSCPTAVSPLSGASGITSSIALGNSTFHLETVRGGAPNVVAGLWSGAAHTVAGRAAAERSATFVEALSGDTWATTDSVTDSANRTVVAYRGMARLGSFNVRNTSLERSTFREGMSPDGRTVVFGSGKQTYRASVTAGDGWERGATGLDFELLDAKSGEVLASHEVAPGSVLLERRAFANLDVPVVSVPDPSNGRSVAAITANRIFFDAKYDDISPVVLDRTTLAPVRFTWEAYEYIRAVHERADGTFDIFSVLSGVIASSKHVAADGTILSRGDGYAAYGQVSAGACGFWSDGRLYPYATARK